ncbi:proton-transporting V-type ATPase complex assembly regulator TMEM9-like isoform X2 [Watersipora subatra]|uniref:proton-transporting V-type ATPase complex assembly regulator TMEM9-like isoform X2 n=1 Tax=Watersipora subatra TaxID=2589382 RepID=UPI00355C4B37
MSSRLCLKAAEDERCRCVCPKLKSIATLNSSHLVVDGIDYTNKAVYISKKKPEDCRCETVLKDNLPTTTVLNIDDIGKFCLRCECTFEQRNTTTQKVVIIFVIVVFGLMFVYALFLMCLDPIMNKRRTHYTQQIDSVAQEIAADEPSGSQTGRRVTAAVKRVKAEQKKWKGQVDEQRHNIYTSHKILA